MKNVVITGVSSGIGRAAAGKFVREGFRVFGSVRKKADGERLSQELGPNFIPLYFDLSDSEGISKEYKRVEETVGEEGICLLVNNGGISGGCPIMHVPVEEVARMLDINVLGLLRVSQTFFPLLKKSAARGEYPTKIVNISSGAGLAVRPYIGAYAASKHAVEAISDAQRRELMRYGIDVVIIEPGPIQTDIWGKQMKKEFEYQDTDYARLFRHMDKGVGDMQNNALPVEKVSDLIYKVYTSRKPKTRNLIAPNYWAFWLAIHVLPDRMIDRMFKKYFDGIEALPEAEEQKTEK